jgi:hypothetical protein
VTKPSGVIKSERSEKETYPFFEGEQMGKKCLIMYTSLSGNTEKVALRFKNTFEKHGWECDMFKVTSKTDILNLPFSFKDYDFVCVGSGLILHLPSEEILNAVKIQTGVDRRPMVRFKLGERPDRGQQATPLKGEENTKPHRHHKIVLGADSKPAVVFATYAGFEFGPKEAEPALQLLALEVEHTEFKCIGTFCCPGKFLNHPTPGSYHGDIRGRPNTTDLLKAKMFIEDKLEEIRKTPDAPDLLTAEMYTGDKSEGG